MTGTLLAAGTLEASLLAALGLVLFHARQHVGLTPFAFLVGAAALTLPFTAHLAPVPLGEAWTVSRAHAVLLPALIPLILLADAYIGHRHARALAALGALAGMLAAIATLAHPTTTPLPPELLPTAPQALLAGTLLTISALAALHLFEIWHTKLPQTPPGLALALASLAAVFAHGLLHQTLAALGAPLAASTWPAIAAVPVLVGLAPVTLVALAATIRHHQLAPLATAHGDDPTTGISRDLDTLRDAETRYREALNNVHHVHETRKVPYPSNEGALVADQRGYILQANQALGWILGCPPDALMGQPATHLLFDDPPTDDLSQLDEGTYTTTLEPPRGPQRTLRITLTRTRAGAHKARIQDITPHHLRRIAQRHQDRARFALDLLAHKLPTHLAAPRTLAEHLAHRAHPDAHATHDDEDDQTPLHELAQRLHTTLENVHRSLERIQPLTHLDATHREALDLTPLLHEAASNLPGSALETLHIEWEIPDAMPVQAGPGLPLVFRELLHNVLQHAGPQAAVRIQADRDDDAWTVQVEDDGPGIPNGLKNRIFDGFTRGRNKGGGLGLPIAQALVEAYDGEIWAEDRVTGTPKEGARFVVRLPAAPHASSTQPPPSDTNRPPA